MYLNQDLYSRLHAICKSVKVAKVGERLVTSIVEDKLVILDYGETYRICCPFCARRGDPDTRHRLWISHAWGVEPADSPIKWRLATCFHNDCLHDYASYRSLRSFVFGIGGERYYKPILVQGKLPSAPPSTPGICVPLTELPKDHSAIKYLQSRGFDPAIIYSEYGVSYCQDSDSFPLAIDRLVMPIVFDGAKVGWQCRYIGTPPSKNIPKYFSAPGMSIKNYLYDYDRAKSFPFVVVVEGIFDAWAIGQGAVALFGKTASRRQLELLHSWQMVLLYLDSDAVEEAHKIAKQLSNKHVIIVESENKDPGELSRERNRALIFEKIKGKI